MSIFTGISTALAIRSWLKSLKDYFDPTIRKIRKKRRGEYFEYDIGSDGDLLFWRDTLTKEFHNPFRKRIEDYSKAIKIGDMVELANANISRWIPLFPGKICSVEGKRVRDKHDRAFPAHRDFGLEEEVISRNDSTVLEGHATVRLLPNNSQYLLCASGVWTPIGIPILVSENLFEKKLQEEISHSGAANAKIVGTLVDLPWEWKERIDRNLSKNMKMKGVYGLPRLVLNVSEVRNVGTAENIAAFAWSQFTTNLKYCALISSIFKPKDTGDIQKAVNMIANYKQFLESPLFGGKWNIDVEFDETKNWFIPGKYRKFKDDATGLFSLYYSCPYGRPVLKPKYKKVTR